MLTGLRAPSASHPFRVKLNRFPMLRANCAFWLCLSFTYASPSCDDPSALQVTRNVTSSDVPDVPLTEWLPIESPGVSGANFFSNAESDANVVSEWTSPRDLAVLPAPHVLRFATGESIDVFSVVPSFGEDGNFIALLLTKNSNKDIAASHDMFCSGPNRSHLTRVRVHHRSLLCDWPKEEAEKESFEVFLEDAQGNNLARVLARRKAGIVKKYQTVACVRDVYFLNEATFSAALKLLVEWLEFYTMHGIEHFFIYTFRGTEDAVKEVLMPYLQSGLATRIHFDDYPKPEPHRFHQVIKDCLYRAKSHSTWVLPSVDFDEYFHLNSGHIFSDGRVPQNYLKTAWDAIVKSEGKQLEEVKSISFRRQRFARARSDSLEISSSWREADLERSRHHREKGAKPKFAYNAHVVYDLWWHYPLAWDPKATQDIQVPETLGVANHYRTDFRSGAKYGDADRRASTFDDKLTFEVPLLEQAIERRFGEKPRTLLKRLSQEHPPVHLGQLKTDFDVNDDDWEDY
eukprot:s546_g12.t1